MVSRSSFIASMSKVQENFQARQAPAFFNRSISSATSQPFLSKSKNGFKRPAVQTPPSIPWRSMSSVRAPSRAAATAAPMPAGPPPTTTTSTSAATGVCRGDSTTIRAAGRMSIP